MRFLLLLLLAPFALFAQQTAPDTLYFGLNSAELTPASKAALPRLQRWLRQHPSAVIIVEGHADQVGTDAANERLSVARARAVRDWLERSGRGLSAATVEGFGAARPLSTGAGPQPRNRRVEVRILEPEAPVAALPDVELEPYRADVPLQRFPIDLDDTVRVRGAGGTEFKIPPGSIQRRKGGVARGQAQLLLREYYQPSEILLAGLHSDSPEGLLQSGGMFFFTIVQEGDTMATTTLKPVGIRMPVRYPELTSMNVYTQPGADTLIATGRDSAGRRSPWHDSRRAFGFWNGRWAFPYYTAGLREAFVFEEGTAQAMRVGGRVEDDFRVGRGWYRGAPRSFAKRVRYEMRKLDSVTIEFTTRLRYRNYGKRKLGRRSLDTTFQVSYMPPQYESYTGSLNWINCDRFYREPGTKVHFIVQTPGYRNMGVLVYFPTIHAFLQARLSGNEYIVDNIPDGLPVELIAVGKQGDQFYWARAAYVAREGGRTELRLQPSTKEAVEGALKSL